jgi:hypothetical protein
MQFAVPEQAPEVAGKKLYPLRELSLVVFKKFRCLPVWVIRATVEK